MMMKKSYVLIALALPVACAFARTQEIPLAEGLKVGETPSRSVPKPIYDAEPGFLELYDKAWELAKVHIHVTKGMPAERYMETVGTCESLVKRPFEHFGA